MRGLPEHILYLKMQDFVKIKDALEKTEADLRASREKVADLQKEQEHFLLIKERYRGAYTWHRRFRFFDFLYFFLPLLFIFGALSFWVAHSAVWLLLPAFLLSAKYFFGQLLEKRILRAEASEAEITASLQKEEADLALQEDKRKELLSKGKLIVAEIEYLKGQ